MTAAPFDFVRAESVQDAVAILADNDEATVVAGGQSLLPLLALRLARPAVVVDIACLEMKAVTVDESAAVLRLGALVRHRTLESDSVVARACPLLASAAALIGHPAIRNRGTLAGSVAHADPAAELPAALVALRGRVVVRGPDGVREVAACDLFQGFLTTSLGRAEVITDVVVPLAEPGRTSGGMLCEWAPRSGDFAVAGVAVHVSRDDRGAISAIGAATCGIGSVPLDVSDAMTAALGASAMSDALARHLAAAVRQRCAGDDDRAELAGLLSVRAVAGALA